MNDTPDRPGDYNPAIDDPTLNVGKAHVIPIGNTDANTAYKHRMWCLIDRMHTTINDLRAEVKFQRELNSAHREIIRRLMPADDPPAHTTPDTTFEDYIL